MFNNVADGLQQNTVSGFGTSRQGGFGENNSSSAFRSVTGFSTNAGVYVAQQHIVCNATTVYAALIPSLVLSHTQSHTQPFYCSLHFVQHNPGDLVPEEIFTHSHLLWSPIVPYLLHLPTMIHGILPVQFTCLAVLFTISLPSFLYILSFFYHLLCNSKNFILMIRIT